ncbi:TIGR03915 family putative DNA repair protein|uniref:Probable DNA metabolism protein n=1 Tax=Dendrosporobacter quercicolus TaxID=146817 RepID=A0A1G9NVM4_9FIRM|nr:TIGR03915 family putative DNA repair protein [Dendrosporobacter quercicolus]NSL47458.1 TIGR03915 family putative DNA repair protein [Dendrosporobacter quercicolus DSM 1736]SDL90363.1 probable DNA metabolism protein [Dendrosporobacter quercicolus]
MHCQPDLIYCYDGSFDGLLCCVFESYEQKEIPLDILSPAACQPLLFSGKTIVTDARKANRVLASIPAKMGNPALNFVRRAFLTSLARKEITILLFLRLGYRYGPPVINMLTNEVVHTLVKAVKHLERESHLLKGFLRFSIINDVLVGEIEPKNFVLPLLAGHFCERYPEERFFIHDKTHGMGLVYQPYQSAVIPVGSLELPEVDEEERTFRKLWQLFYDTIAIQARYNPQCRMSQMPKRYWTCMTEFGPEGERANHRGSGKGQGQDDVNRKVLEGRKGDAIK